MSERPINQAGGFEQRIVERRAIIGRYQTTKRIGRRASRNLSKHSMRPTHAHAHNTFYMPHTLHADHTRRISAWVHSGLSSRPTQEGPIRRRLAHPFSLGFPCPHTVPGVLLLRAAGHWADLSLLFTCLARTTLLPCLAMESLPHFPFHWVPVAHRLGCPHDSSWVGRIRSTEVYHLSVGRSREGGKWRDGGRRHQRRGSTAGRRTGGRASYRSGNNQHK